MKASCKGKLVFLVLGAIFEPTILVRAAAPGIDWIVTCEPNQNGPRALCVDDRGNSYALFNPPALLNHTFQIERITSQAIAKISPTGTVEWSKPLNISPDPILTGGTNGFFILGKKGAAPSDAVISRYSADGNILWETIIKATAEIRFVRLNLDQAGIIHFGGSVYSGTNQIGPTQIVASSNMFRAFVGTMTQDGAFLEVVPLSPERKFPADSMQTATSGATYTFTTFQGAYGNLNSLGFTDCVVSKFVGGSETWLKQLGGTGMEHARVLDLTDKEEILVCGDGTSGTIDFGAGPVQLESLWGVLGQILTPRQRLGGPRACRNGIHRGYN